MHRDSLNTLLLYRHGPTHRWKVIVGYYCCMPGTPHPKWAAVPSILAFRFLSAFSCSDSAARR